MFQFYDKYIYINIHKSEQSDSISCINYEMVIYYFIINETSKRTTRGRFHKMEI
jgi:hypothetical protein